MKKDHAEKTEKLLIDLADKIVSITKEVGPEEASDIITAGANRLFSSKPVGGLEKETEVLGQAPEDPQTLLASLNDVLKKQQNETEYIKKKSFRTRRKYYFLFWMTIGTLALLTIFARSPLDSNGILCHKIYAKSKESPYEHPMAKLTRNSAPDPNLICPPLNKSDPDSTQLFWVLYLSWIGMYLGIELTLGVFAAKYKNMKPGKPSLGKIFLTSFLAYIYLVNFLG
ncbi:MAG: hypothetical protein ABL958_08020 [Bdellovibrionia bacterium]